MSESTESDDDVCNICLEGFQNKNYVKTDHPDDTSIKCCVDCIRKHMEINGNGLISRKPIKSYTIYNHNGEIVKKVDVEQKKQIQKIGDGEVLMSILQDIENENKRIDENKRKKTMVGNHSYINAKYQRRIIRINTRYRSSFKKTNF